MSQADDYARIDHVAAVIKNTDFGPESVVNRTGTVIVLHDATPISGGHWRASFGIQADTLPVDIRGPRFAFDAEGEFRPGTGERPPSEPPAELAAKAEQVRALLHGMREDGVFMTPAELKEVTGAFRDLLASMRAEGLQDDAGHAAKAAMLMASHDPNLPEDMAPGPQPR